MKKILVTGAFGNVGLALIEQLYETFSEEIELVAGIRNLDKKTASLVSYSALSYVLFDFENQSTYETALEGVQTVFLLRPPALADVEKYFKPLIGAFEKANVKEVLFLSVQGADKIKMIPHYKVEQLLMQSSLSYIFLRPSYFMQNLTTTLREDIVQRNEIYLPANKACFNWVDVRNIGEVAALLIVKFDQYRNQALELTGKEAVDFSHVAKLLTKVLGRKITFRSPNLIAFYLRKRRAGYERGMVLVLILLHFLPRFTAAPPLSDNYQKLLGKEPTSLEHV